MVRFSLRLREAHTPARQVSDSTVGQKPPLALCAAIIIVMPQPACHVTLDKRPRFLISSMPVPWLQVLGEKGGKKKRSSTAYQGVADVHGRHAVAPAAAAPSKSSHAAPQRGARPASCRGQGGALPRVLPRHWQRMTARGWRGLQHTQLLAGEHTTAIHVMNQQNSNS